MIQVRNTTVTHGEIERNITLRNGGYRMYWDLYRKMLRMFSNGFADKVWEFSDNVQLSIEEFDRKVRIELAKARFAAYTWLFVWYCILKPLGQFVHKKIRIKGPYKITNGKFENIDVKKHTEYYVFGLLIWVVTGQELSDDDIKEITK